MTCQVRDRRVLYALKHETHAVLDPLWWPDNGKMRDAVYEWLAEAMGLSEHDCHVAKFNEDQCLLAIGLLTRITRKKIIRWKRRRERLLNPGRPIWDPRARS